MPMTAMYDTECFSEIFPSVDDFLEAYQECPIPKKITNDSATTLYYLLYAKYANNPIANYDINQFKYKMFSVIFQFGGTWEKRVDIQDKLRALSEDELTTGSLSIYNHAFNPGTAPSTTSLEELDYINEQNTTKHKRSKMEAYAMLWELLTSDVTGEFINKFKVCFQQIVVPQNPLLYSTEE